MSEHPPNNGKPIRSESSKPGNESEPALPISRTPRRVLTHDGLDNSDLRTLLNIAQKEAERKE